MKYAGLATQLMVLMGLGVWGGIKLDKAAGTVALFTILFPVLALVATLWQIIKEFNKK